LFLSALKFWGASFFHQRLIFRLSEVRNKGKILEGRGDREKNTIAIESHQTLLSQHFLHWISNSQKQSTLHASSNIGNIEVSTYIMIFVRNFDLINARFFLDQAVKLLCACGLFQFFFFFITNFIFQ